MLSYRFDKKSYMSYRLVPILVTLNDLERQNGIYFALFHRIRVRCHRKTIVRLTSVSTAKLLLMDSSFLMPKFVGRDAPFFLKFVFKVTHTLLNPFSTLHNSHIHCTPTNSPPLPGLAHWTDIKVSALGFRVGWIPARNNERTTHPLSNSAISTSIGS